MNYDNISFHNVEDLCRVEGRQGLRIQRVPEDLRAQINEGSQHMMLSPTANVELRFILESDVVEIVLSKSGGVPLKMIVFWGEHQTLEQYEIQEEVTIISLKVNEYYEQFIDQETQATYNPRMLRLMFAGHPEAQLYYHGISKGVIRLPSMSDSPAVTLLAYGTSITQGFLISGPQLTYPFQTARQLGMDLINLGSAGSAFCENVFADYIADRNDWDVAVLSISVNMYLYFDVIAFTERVDYMIKTIALKNPEKSVFCITLFPFFDDVGIYNELSPRNPEAYRQALKSVVSDCGLPNVYLLEGANLLTDFSLLATDLIHPSDLGMVQIAKNLSSFIAKTLKEFKINKDKTNHCGR